MLGVIKEHDPGNDVGENTRQLQGTRGACGNALDVVARVRAPRRPHADARRRADARGRDGGVRKKLAVGMYWLLSATYEFIVPLPPHLRGFPCQMKASPVKVLMPRVTFAHPHTLTHEPSPPPPT